MLHFYRVAPQFFFLFVQTIRPDGFLQSANFPFQVHKIIGFAPTLLQVIMSNEVEMPVRQAGKLYSIFKFSASLYDSHWGSNLGVIYLKNFITTNWADREAENAAVPFSIHEQDRAMIRDAIVDACVHAPELIR